MWTLVSLTITAYLFVQYLAKDQNAAMEWKRSILATVVEPASSGNAVSTETSTSGSGMNINALNQFRLQKAGTLDAFITQYHVSTPTAHHTAATFTSDNGANNDTNFGANNSLNVSEERENGLLVGKRDADIPAEAETGPADLKGPICTLSLRTANLSVAVAPVPPLAAPRAAIPTVYRSDSAAAAGGGATETARANGDGMAFIARRDLQGLRTWLLDRQHQHASSGSPIAPSLALQRAVVALVHAADWAREAACESKHPYSPFLSDQTELHLPGATTMTIRFDLRCQTESSQDYVTIFADR